METIPGDSSELPVRSPDIVTRDDENNELPSSIDHVLSNDNLLIQILLRLPVLSLFLSKSISKHWRSLIESPHFTLLFSQISNIDPPSGIFLQQASFPFKYDFLSLDIRILDKRNRLLSMNYDSVIILQSCNGLLLCTTNMEPENLYDPRNYYVYNPFIKMCNTLPPCLYSDSVKMAFDPTKSPHYKVVLCHVFGSVVHIETYSSETRIWSRFGDELPSLCFSGFEDGIYWNDAIHWLNNLNQQPSHSKLDIMNDTPVLTTIPTNPLDGKEYRDCKLFESRGSLLLLCKDNTHCQQLNVYEMRNGDSEWSVKYLVNLDDIIMPFSERWSVSSGVCCIVLGDRDEDSFMLIQLNKKVVQYKITLKFSCELFELESLSPHSGFEFIASVAGV